MTHRSYFDELKNKKIIEKPYDLVMSILSRFGVHLIWAYSIFIAKLGGLSIDQLTCIEKFKSNYKKAAPFLNMIPEIVTEDYLNEMFNQITNCVKQNDKKKLVFIDCLLYDMLTDCFIFTKHTKNLKDGMYKSIKLDETTEEGKILLRSKGLFFELLEWGFGSKLALTKLFRFYKLLDIPKDEVSKLNEDFLGITAAEDFQEIDELKALFPAEFILFPI